MDPRSTGGNLAFRSQRRLDITALEKRYESIGSDRHLTVGGKDEKKHTIAGDYIANVFEDYHLHVGDPEFPAKSGNRNTLLEQNENLQVKGSSNELVGGNWSVTVGGLVSITNVRASLLPGGLPSELSCSACAV